MPNQSNGKFNISICGYLPLFIKLSDILERYMSDIKYLRKKLQNLNGGTQRFVLTLRTIRSLSYSLKKC